MSDEKKTIAMDGWTVKGHKALGEKIQGGFKPATGSLGTPPTTGTAVAKPAETKKE